MNEPKRIKKTKKLLKKEKVKLCVCLKNKNDEESKRIIDQMADIDEHVEQDVDMEDEDYMKKSDGGTALILACNWGRFEIAKYLIDLGADINKCNFNEGSPLQSAVFKNEMEIVKLLLNAGANINHCDSSLNSALTSAGNNVEMAKFLIDFGIDLKVCGGDALMNASYFNYFEVVKMLVELGVDVNSTDDEGSNSLHCACENNHFAVIEYLLENGGDINKINDFEEKPIDVTESQETKSFINNFNCSKFVLK